MLLIINELIIRDGTQNKGFVLYSNRADLRPKTGVLTYVKRSIKTGNILHLRYILALLDN